MRQDGSQSRPLYPHLEHKDEQRVQEDVQNCPDEHRAHGHQSLALGGNVGVQPQGQLDKNGTGQIDGDVIQRVADGGLRSAKGHQRRFFDDGKYCGQYGGQKQQQGGGITQNFFCPRPVAGAQADGGQRCAAHTSKGGKSGDQHKDGEGDAQTGEGSAAYLWDVTNIDAVHNVVEHVDELGGHCGQGQFDHQRADRGAGQRLLASVRLGQNNFLQYNLRRWTKARTVYREQGQYSIV